MNKFSLLYVDDEESNLRIFKDTFRRKFNVYTAISAKEGMKILDENQIDLVLSDQRMPEMSGVEFLKYTLDKYPEPNRILITGYTDFGAIENAINSARIFQYVQKPWEEKHLLDIIDDALNTYNLERENKRQKEELIIAKEKAERSDKLKTEFLHNLSHEIRTPMNAIIGFIDLLDDENIDGETQKHYISIIRHSGNQLLRVIDDILEISALETKHVKVIEQKINLNVFFDELYSIFQGEANKKGLTFVYSKGLSDDQSNVYIDESKLNKILDNLLINSFKYTKTGKIEFGYKLVNNNLEIFVEDTGVGIDISKQAKIFERFSQEEEEINLEIGGLGLGLSIAKENVELMGGKISLFSEKNKGAKFVISLPYKRSKTDNKDNIDNELSFSSQIQTVLVAEDEDLNFMFIKAFLKKYRPNYKIIRAKNGQEVLDICEKSYLSLILMDLKMPIIDGYEASRKIREKNINVPIIAQTAFSTSNDKQKAIEAGCNAFISKPIDEQEFLNILSRIFEN
ncbi:MAG: response regulator [Bacteroidales bacterium]|nr:response regulator [Bacteroidales bacterium]